MRQYGGSEHGERRLPGRSGKDSDRGQRQLQGQRQRQKQRQELWQRQLRARCLTLTLILSLYLPPSLTLPLQLATGRSAHRSGLALRSLPVEKAHELPVALFFEILHRDEAERGRVDAVAQAGRRGTVVKNVTEV